MPASSNRPALRKLLVCGGILSLAGWAPLAGQSPEPKLPPKRIFGSYALSGSGRAQAGRDSIRVTPRAHGKVNVSLKLYYANGHTCQLDQEGEWRGDRVLVMADGIAPNQACRLEASFPPGRIRLADEGQRCAQVYCGTRGKLDGRILSKSAR